MKISDIKKMRREDFKAWRNDCDEKIWAIALCDGDWFDEALNCVRDGDMGDKDKDGDYSRIWGGDEIWESEKASVRPATYDEVRRYIEKVGIRRYHNEEYILIHGSDSSYVLYEEIENFKPHYRPFGSAEEVMEAIKVHGDWVRQGHDIYRRIDKVTTIGSKVTISLSGMKDWGTNELENLGEFRFLDGTPFGKLVEE